MSVTKISFIILASGGEQAKILVMIIAGVVISLLFKSKSKDK